MAGVEQSRAGGAAAGPAGQRAPSGLVTVSAGPAGAVAVLRLDSAPLNALTAALRRDLAEALSREAEREAGARPVVIAGSAVVFSAATLVELGAAVAQGAPSLADICRQIEEYPAPVVAALSGRAAGPGAELALACHARVLHSAARLIFPEAGLGLTPMAGTSQRLPRLAGAAEALDILLNARALTAEQALAAGLADHVTEGDPLEAAIAEALRMQAPRPVTARDDGLRDVAGFAAAVAAARRDNARNPMPAAARIIDCVEAALYLPPENGFALETVCFEDLRRSPESRGLIAAARSEQAAHMLPAGIAAVQGEEIRVLGLAGAGPQLAALALLALGRGMRVIWGGTEAGGDAVGVQKITAWVRERLEAETRSGRLTPAQRDSDLVRFETGQPVQALAEAGLVIHARADAALAEQARLQPGITRLVIGGAPGRAGLAIAPSGRVCELSSGGAAGPVALASVWRLMRSFGLPPVLSGGLPQIGRQVFAAGQAALAQLLALGVPRRLIATALDGFGQALPDLPEPGTDMALRAMTAEEVTRRWLAAMANEGYRLIAEGTAPGEAAIDVLMVQGYGFPRWRGGPMHQAAERGPMVIRSDLRRWQEDHPLWTPHPALDRLVSEGRGATGRGGAL